MQIKKEQLPRATQMPTDDSVRLEGRLASAPQKCLMPWCDLTGPSQLFGRRGSVWIVVVVVVVSIVVLKIFHYFCKI